MESQESDLTTAFLAFGTDPGADAARIAEVVVSTWQDIDAALGPVIGKGGVAALYGRSLYLSASSHPWLGGLHAGDGSPMDLAALQSILAQQDAAAATAAGLAVLQTFHGLLASLVGPSLTERLLRSVWTRFSTVSNIQRPSP